MDTATPEKTVDDKITEAIAQIKTHMPDVYASIQRKAREIGGDAFALVRRGLRGERGCFYAMEAGMVVGAPFDKAHPDMQIAARAMVEFGCAHVCIWPLSEEEARIYGAA